MRGKYKRKKLNKKYKRYADQFQYYNKHPYVFVEEMFGIKLSWWQKLLVKVGDIK